jgi:hypothetical protein
VHRSAAVVLPLGRLNLIAGPLCLQHQLGNPDADRSDDVRSATFEMADIRSPTSIHPALTNPHALPLASIFEASPLSPFYKSAGAQSLATTDPNGLKSISQCAESLGREHAPEHLTALNTKRYS